MSDNEKYHQFWKLFSIQWYILKEGSEQLCGEEAEKRPRRVVQGYHQFNGQLIQVHQPEENHIEIGFRHNGLSLYLDTGPMIQIFSEAFDQCIELQRQLGAEHL